jgi:hypothetical protein
MSVVFNVEQILLGKVYGNLPLMLASVANPCNTVATRGRKFFSQKQASKRCSDVDHSRLLADEQTLLGWVW